MKKHTTYSVTQAQWQEDFTQLIIKHDASLKDVANLYKDDQLLMIKKNKLAVSLLLGEAPDHLKHKLNTGNTLNAWLTLQSTDELELASLSKAYKQALQQAEAAKTRAPHPDGEKLRRLVREELAHSSAFLTLLAAFNTKTADIQAIQCQQENN